MPRKVIRYCLLVVKRDGELIPPAWDDLSLIARARALIDEVHAFLARLGHQPADRRHQFGSIKVRWLPLGAGDAVATVLYPDGPRHTLLLLGGSDAASETAALDACEELVRTDHPRTRFAEVRDAVRVAPRPLLVSFGNDGWGRGDWSFRPTEGVLAAAYLSRLNASNRDE